MWNALEEQNNTLATVLRKHVTSVGVNEGGAQSTGDADTLISMEHESHDRDDGRAIEEMSEGHSPCLQQEDGKEKQHHQPCVRQVGTVHNCLVGTLEKPLSCSRRKTSTFAAIDFDIPQPDAGNVIKSDIVSTTQEGKKKRLKRGSSRHRQRVEKCTLNTADHALDRSKLTMRELIQLAEAKAKMSKESTSKKLDDGGRSETSRSTQIEDQSQKQEGLAFAPQVQVVDGRIVINQESLMVPACQLNNTDNYQRVEETHSRLNYHSYMKKAPNDRWTAEATELFYKGRPDVKLF